MFGDRANHSAYGWGWRVCALAATYFALAGLTIGLTRFEGGLAFIWLATAPLLASLVLVEKRSWPELILGCSIASFMATWQIGLGLEAAAPLALVNMAEALVGAWLLCRFSPRFGEFGSLREIATFLVAAGVVAPALTAFPGAAVASIIADVPYWRNWTAWYTGHGLGAVTFGPLFILILRGDLARWIRNASTAQYAEALALLALLTAVTVGVFAQSALPLLFLPFLPMMLAVFRLGRLGAILSVLVLVTVGTTLTIMGLGPLTLIELETGFRAHFFQLYLATAVLMVLPAAWDLKHRKRAVQELEEQAALHRLILDRSGDVIMTLELDGRIRFVSPSAKRILGVDPEMLLGKMSDKFVHPDDAARILASHHEALAEPERTITVDYRAVFHGKEIGWFESQKRATIGENGEPSGTVSVIRNITARKAAEHQLKAEALTDPLTNIPNRRAFNRAMGARLTADDPVRPAVLAIFDLDRFKLVNDRHGHATGDNVLRIFCDILRRGVREGDFIARMGGEEFVAILANADLDEARILCDRIRRDLESHRVSLPDGSTLQVTVSVGMAPLPPEGSTAAVLQAADAALYRAKQEGRNRLVSSTQIQGSPPPPLPSQIGPAAD